VSSSCPLSSYQLGGSRVCIDVPRSQLGNSLCSSIASAVNIGFPGEEEERGSPSITSSTLEINAIGILVLCGYNN
jgi:hypothetical protein